MIGRLRGKSILTKDNYAIIDVAGVGYQVFCSSKTLANLEDSSSEVSLYIETHVREEHIHLYGFMSEVEQDWFNLLCKVQGVGTKMAIAIMSVFTPSELFGIISSGDITSVTQVSGVGKKIASRIITELATKVAKMPIQGDASATVIADSGNKSTQADGKNSHNQIRDDAISALINLGYSRDKAFRSVMNAIASCDDITLDNIIASSLKEVAA